jgi:hypothetical protein
MRVCFAALGWWLGLALWLPGQSTGLVEAKGLRAEFFSKADGWPWARASVGGVHRELQKLGFFSIGFLPTLVMDDGALDLDLGRFDTGTASQWLRSLMENPKTRGARVSQAKVILREDGKVLWECTANEAILGSVEGLALRGVTLRDSAGVTRKAGVVLLVLDREAGCLRVTLPGTADDPGWSFILPKP